MKSLEKLSQIAAGLNQLPAVLVDLERFDLNAAHAARLVKELNPKLKIRVATKSIRVPDLIRRVLDSDPVYQGLMCYSAHEALFLANEGFDDLMIAYPTLQNGDLLAFRQLHEWGKRVYLMVDSEEGIRRVSEVLGEQKTPARLLLDVDMSLRLFGGRLHAGVRRSPVRGLEEVKRIFDSTREIQNVHLCGLMGYEAQVAGLGDRNPFKRILNLVYAWVRRRSVRHVARFREQMVGMLSSEGYALELVNGGGTGSLNYTSKEQSVTEVTVGSGFLSSHLFDYYSNIRFQPACFFACHVCRQSDPDYVTCQGGGYIASGAAGPDKQPLAVYPQGVHTTEAEGCGEVQTPVTWQGGGGLKPGEVVLFRHAKAGELAERFNEYQLIATDGRISTAHTYRGFGECYF